MIVALRWIGLALQVVAAVLGMSVVLAWLGDHQTILVAVYGAVVATAVAVWNIYRRITDRGQLRVGVDDASADARQLATQRLAFLGAWDSFNKIHKLQCSPSALALDR